MVLFGNSVCQEQGPKSGFRYGFAYKTNTKELFTATAIRFHILQLAYYTLSGLTLSWQSVLRYMVYSLGYNRDNTFFLSLKVLTKTFANLFGVLLDHKEFA